jgi:hypothetical protein
MRTRRDAALAVAIAAALLLLGVALGSAWYRLAPAELSVVLSDGTTAPLPTESSHLFDGVALFTLMGLGAGLVSGAALWQWRSQRGPILLIAGAAASLLSAWVAYRCGLLLAGTPNTDLAAGTLIAVPPVLGSAIVTVAQPLGATLAYGTAASFSGDHNLGRADPGTPGLGSAPLAELSSGSAVR